MIKNINTSDTLVGSLSREIQSIRMKEKGIFYSMNNCKSTNLLNRLKKEMEYLSSRKNQILNIVNDLGKSINGDITSIDFLIEICKRSVRYDLEI